MSAPIGREEWAALRRESTAVLPELAATLGLPKLLLPYQGKAVGLLDTSAMKVLFIEKSRRIGLTWGLGAYAALKAGKSRQAGGMDVMYISYSQDMTREFIDAVAMWAKAYAVAAFELEEFLFDDTDKADPSHTRQIQAFRIRFASGFEVTGLSSAPRSLRGKQGVVIIDEAAFVDNLAELLKAALAFLMWGGQVVVCSTHNGAENEFNAKVQDILAGRLKYGHMRIDFDEALQDGLYQRICLVTGKQWSPEAEAAWRQEIIDFYGDGADEELFCVPAQGSGSWLTAPLIEARMTLAPEAAPVIRIELPDNYLQLTKLQQAQLFEPQFDKVKRAADRASEDDMHGLGYDPARRKDPAVISLLAVKPGLQRQSVLTVEMRNVPFDEQKRIARHLVKNSPRQLGFAIDATGMGMNLAEDLGREFGLRSDETPGGLVWAITLNPKWYNINFPPLKAAFEDGMIALARDAGHLADLRLVKVIRGIPMIPEERVTVEAKKRHGDSAVSLALAHFTTRMQWAEFSYTPAGRADQDKFMSARDDELPERDWWAQPLGAGLRGGI